MPRLPMTLNVILGQRATRPQRPVAAPLARKSRSAGRQRRMAGDRRRSGEPADVPGGPLEQTEPADIDRIETNLQIAHAPKSAVRDFRTDYLMKCSATTRRPRAFEESLMEKSDRSRAHPVRRQAQGRF